jgi:hypothetical protein
MKTRRTGLYIRGRRGEPEVRVALIKFARWLRSEYEFPIRVPVYLSPNKFIRTMHSDDVSASFFAPWDCNAEPYIRIATGYYKQLKEDHVRDNALSSFIISLSHEIVHYRQWVETRRASAIRMAKLLMRTPLPDIKKTQGL